VSNLFKDIMEILKSIPSDDKFWQDGSFDRLVAEIKRISLEKLVEKNKQ
jgi:hypothetical protein